MKKKNGFNIMLFVFIINLIFILSCSKGVKSKHAGELLETDRNFSQMSVKEGMFSAFLSILPKMVLFYVIMHSCKREGNTSGERFEGKATPHLF